MCVSLPLSQLRNAPREFSRLRETNPNLRGHLFHLHITIFQSLSIHFIVIPHSKVANNKPIFSIIKNVKKKFWHLAPNVGLQKFYKNSELR